VEIKESRLDLVFSFLDPDGNGKISAESIRSALGEDISAQELAAMIKAGDRDGDNMVSKA
jgi:Ca2+-binding EF-hand superfamily protein